MSTTPIPPDPNAERWDAIRKTVDQVRSLGRAFLFGQAWLGWQLATLKKAHGIHRGRPEKNSANLAELLPWDQLVERETGLPRRSADRFIAIFEATQAKLKRIKAKDNQALAAIGKKGALAIFSQANPLALPEAQQEALKDIIASLCDGQTQGSLMEELGIVPTPKMPAGAGKKAKEPEMTAGEKAVLFFEGLFASVSNTRTATGYKELLHALPPEGDGPSLAVLESETRAFLADLEEARQSKAKPAKGRVIS